MTTAHVPIPTTDADVLRIAAANPGWRIERSAAGEVTMTPPTGGATSNRNLKLAMLVGAWADRNGFVAFDSNGGFKFDDSSIVAPDASLVSAPEWDALTDDEREGFIPIIPVVAIELLSKTDRIADTQAKLLRLREIGVAYVVMLDPYRGSIWTDGVPPAAFDIDFTSIIR